MRITAIVPRIYDKRQRHQYRKRPHEGHQNDRTLECPARHVLHLVGEDPQPVQSDRTQVHDAGRAECHIDEHPRVAQHSREEAVV